MPVSHKQCKNNSLETSHTDGPGCSWGRTSCANYEGMNKWLILWGHEVLSSGWFSRIQASRLFGGASLQARICVFLNSRSNPSQKALVLCLFWGYTAEALLGSGYKQTVVLHSGRLYKATCPEHQRERERTFNTRFLNNNIKTIIYWITSSHTPRCIWDRFKKVILNHQVF